MHIVQEINIAIVFFISGLTLKTDEMMQALRYKFELAYGMIAILFLTGFLGFAFRVIPLVPPEFSIGEFTLAATVQLPNTPPATAAAAHRPAD